MMLTCTTPMAAENAISPKWNRNAVETSSYRIDVMNVVKPPEKWHPMIGQMPVVKDQIHQEKTDREFEPARQCHQVNEAERLLR